MTRQPGLILLFGLLSLALSGCLDRVDEYDTIDDAKKNHVFDKGWLPDILPPSTHDLKVVTTVEISAGRGNFSFDPQDYGAFYMRLSAYNGRKSKVDEDNRAIERLLAKGYEARAYSLGATNWLFLCRKAEAVCEFFVWQ
jgi:hypothetical protein